MKLFERQTKLSQEVDRILNNAKTPLSVSQIKSQLKDIDLTPNPSTLYRIIDKLKQKNLLEEVSLNSQAYYEYKQKQHHHHHFLCEGCGLVTCLDQCVIEAMKINLQKLLPNPKFKLKRHEFSMVGLCDSCS